VAEYESKIKNIQKLLNNCQGERTVNDNSFEITLDLGALYYPAQKYAKYFESKINLDGIEVSYNQNRYLGALIYNEFRVSTVELHDLDSNYYQHQHLIIAAGIKEQLTQRQQIRGLIGAAGSQVNIEGGLSPNYGVSHYMSLRYHFQWLNNLGVGAKWDWLAGGMEGAKMKSQYEKPGYNKIAAVFIYSFGRGNDIEIEEDEE
jgi:hypothetical protein